MAIPFTRPCDQIEHELRTLGIPTDRPDFYNNPEFIGYVSRAPEILNNYARFVRCRQYSDHYLRYAERVITIVAESLYREMTREERLGACADAAGVILQVLEMEGVWCYQVRGSLTVSFPLDSGIPPIYFYSVNPTGTNFAGHSWIVAPPFAIVDVAIKLQPYEDAVKRYLPDVVVQKDVSVGGVTAIDVYSPAYIASALHQGVSLRRLNVELQRGLGAFHSVFPVATLVTEAVTGLKYIPMGIVSLDRPLEENRSLCLNGNYGYAVYENLLKPNLLEAGLAWSDELI